MLTLPTTYNGNTGPLEMPRAQWLELMRREWRQGQHVAVMGRTGRGKTTLVRDLAAVRAWVVVLAIKRADDTLASFPTAGYKVIDKWPPKYGIQRVVLWAKPKNLREMADQRGMIARVLDDVYENGGWCLVLDDTARIVNALGFKKEVSTMLNEARSSHASIMSVLTQPSSVTQAIPSEVWRQVRFLLAFHYRVGRDLDAIADITGYDKKTIAGWMSLLRPFDFLAFDDLTDSVILVRT